MAQKVEPPVNPPKRTAPGKWLPWAVIAAAAVGAMVAFHGQKSVGSDLVSSDLPVPPDLTGRPAELGQMLRAAQQRATTENGSVESIAALGLIYHANGFIQEAGACWRILHAVQPREARWCYYLSDLSQQRADETGLRSWLEETVRLVPDYAPAWLELARLEFKTGHFAKAERAYNERTRLVPGDPYAGLGLARIALQQDRRAEGKQLIEALIKRVPEFSSSHNMYAEILVREGDERGAANHRWLGTVAGRFRAPSDPWKEELRPWCCDVNQLIVWGAIDLQTKFGDRGKTYFERAVRIDPQNPQGFENLGLFLLETGNPAKAAEIWEQGSILPHATELLFSYLSGVYLTLRQPGKALQTADRGLRLMPNSSRFYNLRGLALAASDHPQEAMAAYRLAMTCAPSSANPVANLGITLLRLGRKEEAVATLKQALELQPGYTQAVTTLAYLELEAGNLPAAAAYIFPYFQQFPGLPDARTLMGRFYVSLALAAARRGDIANVEKACRDGLAIVAESPDLQGFLGMHYLQQERWNEALGPLESSYQQQPSDPRVALALVQLYLRLERWAEARTILDATEGWARQHGDTVVAKYVVELRQRLP